MPTYALPFPGANDLYMPIIAQFSQRDRPSYAAFSSVYPFQGSQKNPAMQEQSDLLSFLP